MRNIVNALAVAILLMTASIGSFGCHNERGDTCIPEGCVELYILPEGPFTASCGDEVYSRGQIFLYCGLEDDPCFPRIKWDGKGDFGARLNGDYYVLSYQLDGGASFDATSIHVDEAGHHTLVISPPSN